MQLNSGAENAFFGIFLAGDRLPDFDPRNGCRLAPARIYLSTTLYGSDLSQVPVSVHEQLRFVHPYEMPDKLNRLLMRSTSWLRSRRIYAPEEKQVQADDYFAQKMAGGALKGIQGYFDRKFFSRA